MRNEPGSNIASYHVSTFWLPSLSMFVVFCTKVAVLYQDFAYFFCIAWTRSSVVLILAAKVVGAHTSRTSRGKVIRCIFDVSLKSIDSLCSSVKPLCLSG